MKLIASLRKLPSVALRAVSVLAILISATGTASAATPASTGATIVLVHGALADASSWDGVISKLEADGFAVIAVADPLRNLMSDSDYVSGIVKNVKGPVVLVGHSYGGSIITNAATGADNVKALVYIAAYAPESGESAFDLTGKFPGSILPGALATPIALADGAHDLYVQQDKLRAVFAADVPLRQAKLMAATQRPVTDVALKGASGAPAWKRIPSWFVYGDADKVIPPAAHAFMAQRAGAKDIVVVKGASHVVMVSHPGVVANLIEMAAAARVN
jgi:pimeloyl-ACP methyl ester carboxylesterase